MHKAVEVYILDGASAVSDFQSKSSSNMASRIHMTLPKAAIQTGRCKSLIYVHESWSFDVSKIIIELSVIKLGSDKSPRM